MAALAVGVSLAVTYGFHAIWSASLQSSHPLAFLNLSPPQREKIDALSREFHPKLRELRNQIRDRRARLAGLLADHESGDPAIQECLDEVMRLEAELDNEVVKNLLSLKPHLTREQQLKLFRYIQLRDSPSEEDN